MPEDTGLEDLEGATGVSFTETGWQGLSNADRKKIKDYYRTHGGMREFRRGFRKKARAAGRLGLDITPEKGAEYEEFQEDINELAEALNQQTGEAIRDYTVGALEQAERGGMPAGATSAIAQQGMKATMAAQKIEADARSALEDWWTNKTEAEREAIQNEVLRQKEATGETIGGVVGTAAGAIPLLFGGTAVAPATMAAGASLGKKVGGWLGGPGTTEQYEAATQESITSIEENTAYLEELLKLLQRGDYTSVEDILAGAPPMPQP